MLLDQYRKEISKEALKDFKTGRFEGNIHLVDELAALPAALELLKGHSILGIDTETKPAFKKGITHQVALLQIATPSDVVIIRLNKIGLPPEVVKIFNSRRIIKVGIAVHDDIKDLKQLSPALRPAQVVDLNKLAAQIGFVSIGAKKLSALILGFSISKSEQTSNWETETLSKGQLSYAATDAWICTLIYQKIKDFIV